LIFALLGEVVDVHPASRERPHQVPRLAHPVQVLL
jgi:hypothetical protein